MGQTFKINLQNIAEEESLDQKVSFSINISMDKYVYLKSLISYHVKQGNLSYRIKASFSEGLNLLKKENPLIKDDIVLERRYYTGGEQKVTEKRFITSVMFKRRDINWINNYIVEQRKKNEFFSKTDFFNNLVEQLQKKYGKDL